MGRGLGVKYWDRQRRVKSVIGDLRWGEMNGFGVVGINGDVMGS